MPLWLRAAIALVAFYPHYIATAAAQMSNLVIQNARVFDGAKVLPQASVIMQNGLITAVGTNLKLRPGAEVLDAAGKTLLPGLIDAHTHVRGSDVLRAALVFGVTTEFDMFMSTDTLADIRKELSGTNGAAMADLRSAGTLVTAPKGHGTEYGVVIPTLDSPDQAQAFVDARIAEGSDYIKIVYDDGKAYGLTIPTLSQAALKAVIAAAHARGKLAVVHIGSLQGARDALEAGADGLAHLFVDQMPDTDFGRLAAAHHAFVVPTLTVLQSVCNLGGGVTLLADPALAPYLSVSDATQLRRTFPKAATNYPAAEAAIEQLKAAKVPILAGTDAPNPGTTHGASLHLELELLVKAGLTPTEALAAATSIPAERFALSDRGTIAPGKRADLLLVEGDPTTDIKATRRIAGVWKQGVAADRAAYRAEIEQQQTEAKKSEPPPAGSEDGLVSDFDGREPSVKFGSGWQVSTNSLRGGKSSATFRVVEGGAQKSKGSLLVEGEVAPGLPYAWSGAIFFPGSTPMAPANLSAKKQISFWAKGDGRTYSLMLFAPSKNFAPVSNTFVAGPEWQEFIFPLAKFDGLDGHDLAGLFFGASLPAGKFAFQVDEVRFR